MTHLEAIETVEHALTSLKLSDGHGGQLEGIEAAGVVARRIGESWDSLVNDFESSRISPNAYAVRACDMIYEFKKRRMAGAA